MESETFEAKQNSRCRCGGSLGQDGKDDPANAVDEATFENFLRAYVVAYTLTAMAQRGAFR